MTVWSQKIDLFQHYTSLQGAAVIKNTVILVLCGNFTAADPLWCQTKLAESSLGKPAK